MDKVITSASVDPTEVYKNLGTQEKVQFILECWNSISGSLKSYILSKFSKEDELILENELLMRKHEKEIY